jgi:hypothetical protein
VSIVGKAIDMKRNDAKAGNGTHAIKHSYVVFLRSMLE